MIDKILIDFTFAQVSKFMIYFIIWYITGLLVLKAGVRVNYTRKINHFALLFIPFAMDMILKNNGPATNTDTEQDIWLQAFGLMLGILYLLIFLPPFRNRIGILRTAFSSVDRPEDRPYTLL